MAFDGTYVAFHRAEADHAEVHAMTPGAYKTRAMLALSLPPTGIGPVYLSILGERVGVDRPTLETYLAELERPRQSTGLGWIAREGLLVWVVDMLAEARNLSPDNWRHRKATQRAIAGLQDCSLVRRFRARYPGWFAPVPDSQSDSLSKGNTKGFGSQSDHRGEDNHNQNRDSSSSTARENDDESEGDRVVMSPTVSAAFTDFPMLLRVERAAVRSLGRVERELSRGSVAGFAALVSWALDPEAGKKSPAAVERALNDWCDNLDPLNKRLFERYLTTCETPSEQPRRRMSPRPTSRIAAEGRSDAWKLD